MKIAVLYSGAYGKESWSGNLTESLISLGHEVIQLNPSVLKPYDVLGFDLVISYGMKSAIDPSIPRLVIDLGYSDRYQRHDNPIGYLQTSVNNVANPVVPTVNNKRQIYKVEPIKVDETLPILILGQKEDDKQHRMNAKQLKDYYTNIIQEIGMQHPNHKIIFRNHPKSKVVFKFNGVENDEHLDSSELVNKVSKVYTYNSTGGLEFIKHCIPVITDLNAYYYSQGFNPTIENVTDLFCRLGYSQWTSAELKEPSVVKDILEYTITGKIPTSWSVEQVKLKPKAKEIEIPVCQEEVTEYRPSSYEIDGAYVILKEQDHHKKLAIYRQIFPGSKARSKKAIQNHIDKVFKAAGLTGQEQEGIE